MRSPVHNNLIRNKYFSRSLAIPNAKRTSRGGHGERRKKRKILRSKSSRLSSSLPYRRVVDYPHGDCKQSTYSREFPTICCRQPKGHTKETRDFRRFQLRGVTNPCARVLIHLYVKKGVAFVSDHYSVHIPINPVRRVYQEDNERKFR